MSKSRHVTFRGRQDKLIEVAHLFSDYLKGDVLDVGCDAKYLSSSVQGRYIGVDFAGVPDIAVNIETGLPFHDKTFDTVIAFDVLEHLDSPHFAFDEICRTSRSFVIVGLPNAYEWHFRLLFLLGKNLGGKYGLPLEPIHDRHKWLFSLREAVDFVKQRGNKNCFEVVDEIFAYYGYKRFFPKVVSAIGRIMTPSGASLFVYHYWAVLQRASKIR